MEKMTIGKRIKKRREELGMTQEQLADVLYIKKNTISYYEKDKIDIKISALVNIARALSTSVSYLVGEEPEGEREEIAQVLRLAKGIKNEEFLRMAIEQLKTIVTTDKLYEKVQDNLS